MKGLRQLAVRRAACDENYARFVALLPQAFIEAGPDGTLIFCNRHAWSLFGYNSQKDVTKTVNVFDHIAQEDRKKLKERLGSMMNGIDVTSLECWLNRRDGSRFSGILYINPVYSGSKPSGFRAIIADMSDKRRVEAALRESEEKYRLVVENANDTIIVVQDGMIRFASQNTCMARTPQEMISRSFNDFIHPEDREKISNFYGDMLRGSSVKSSISFRYFRSDGVHRWAGLKATKFEWEGGPAVLYFVSDITERKLAEMAIEQSEARYRHLVENSSDIIITADPQGFLTYINPAATRISGYAVQDIVGKHYLEFIDPDYRERMDAALRQQLQERTSSTYIECPAITGRGSRKWLGQHIHLVFAGKRIVGWQAEARDITDRVIAEEAYKALVNHSGQGLIIIQDDQIVFANDRFLEISGYGRDYIFQLPPGAMWELFHNDDRAHVMRRYHDVLEGRIQYSADELRGYFGGADIRWVETFCSRLEYRGCSALQVSFIDITERKRAEEAVKRHRQELEIKSVNLEEANTALKVLLNHREEEKIKMEEKLSTNLKELVLPYIQKLKSSRLAQVQINQLDIMEKNLNDILAPFLHHLTSRYTNLTPREIEIITLIKSGRTTKEIAGIINASARTIDFHRNNIRGKLGLKNKRANLRSFLLSMQ